MILVGNGRLITRNSNNDFYENGAVVIDGKKIIDVGEYNLLKEKYKGAEFIDANNKLIMPSYINCHEHIYSAFARGLQIKNYNPNGFLDILNGLWWTIDRNLTLHDIYLSAMATFIDSIKCGVTTTFDHHASFGSIIGSLKEIEKARIETGMRACLCYEISDRDGMDNSKESVLENIDFIKYAINDKSDMVKAMMGMHAQFTISDETFKFAMENKPKEVGVHIHVAEGIEDLQDSLNKHGKRIVDRLYDFGVLSEKTLLAHCIYVNEHEMDLIRDTNTMVVITLLTDAKIKYKFDNSLDGFKVTIFRKKRGGNTVKRDLTDTEMQILELLKLDGYYTAEDISEKIGKTPRTAQRAIGKLVEKKYIERVGGNKNGYWEIIK